MRTVIMAFGIFLNEFPYFMLAMTLMWNHLRVTRRSVFLFMLAVTSLHAASIMLLTFFAPPAVVGVIKIPHEVMFTALFVGCFIYCVKLKLTRLLFMSFFIKYFADLTVNYASYIGTTFWPDKLVGSYSLAFNLIHLALLCVAWPLMYLFIERVLRQLYLAESDVWKYLWLTPAAFYALLIVYSRFSIDTVATGEYLVSATIQFGISLLVYALIFETLRTAQAKYDAERKAEVLDRVNLLKTDLMRTISHEMRTPLAVIMGFAEITAEDARKNGMTGEAAANMDAIAQEARRMADMMEEMRQLALAREYSKDRRPVDMGAVIRQIAGLYGKVLERKGTVLNVSAPDNLPSVLGSDSELIQVCFNLLRNADTHTENGTITINAEQTDDSVTITVSDTGTGISPDILPRVFARGVHGEDGGTGFGLAICKDIITAYEGEISITSEPGKGTAVTFTLPALSERGGA